MEIALKLPNELCERIIASEFQLEIDSLTEEHISKTIDLYVEATTFYSSVLCEQDQDNEPVREAIIRRSQFYQDKIKRLLARGDVQQCLGGKKNSPKGLDLQRTLSKAKENAPEQAKMLLEYYKQHMKQQDTIIEQSLTRQRRNLDQRIKKRSVSKAKKQHVLGEITFQNIGKERRSFVMTNF